MPADWSQARCETMERWLAYKTECRKRYKPSSWQALLAKLAPLSDEDLEACVSESLAQGWAGLFPDKFTSPRPTGSSPGHPQFLQKKEGAAPPVTPIKPADFPWRELALNVRGEELVGTWEEQDGRTRRELRNLWSELPPATKAAQWELAKGGATNDES